MYGYGIRAYDMDIACFVGDRGATLLDFLHHLTLDGEGEVIKGLTYVTCGYLSLAESYFPIWSVRTMQRAFEELVKRELVFKKKGVGYDRRNRFAVNYSHEFLVNNKYYNNPVPVKIIYGPLVLCDPLPVERKVNEQESI